jgi:hypothetical protein
MPEFAFMVISGIIATILGKTATLIKVAGRERRVHHSKSLPLLRNGERFFFGPSFTHFSVPQVFKKISLNNRLRFFCGLTA